MHKGVITYNHKIFVREWGVMNSKNNKPGGFIDFIPEGEDQGAFGSGRYVDFVPRPEPESELVIEEKPQDIKKPQGKGKSTRTTRQNIKTQR